MVLRNTRNIWDKKTVTETSLCSDLEWCWCSAHLLHSTPIAFIANHAVDQRGGRCCTSIVHSLKCICAQVADTAEFLGSGWLAFSLWRVMAGSKDSHAKPLLSLGVKRTGCCCRRDTDPLKEWNWKFRRPEILRKSVSVRAARKITCTTYGQNSEIMFTWAQYVCKHSHSPVAWVSKRSPQGILILMHVPKYTIRHLHELLLLRRKAGRTITRTRSISEISVLIQSSLSVTVKTSITQ